MKHTPGPWHLGIGNGEGSIFTDAETRMRMEDKGTTLYPICKVIDGWDREEDEANAHLIAAAPDLLEACKTAEKYFSRLSYLEPEKYRDIKSTWEIISQAIAKAEGKE